MKKTYDCSPSWYMKLYMKLYGTPEKLKAYYKRQGPQA